MHMNNESCLNKSAGLKRNLIIIKTFPPVTERKVFYTCFGSWLPSREARVRPYSFVPPPFDGFTFFFA